jgi:hypothetical protein
VSGIDLSEVVAKLECHGRTASIIDAGSPDMSAVPAQWAAIARSGDAEERRLLALSRWNRDFLDLIPGYAAALRTKLVDVRVCALSGEGLILLYFFDESDPTYSITIGWDPASFGAKEPIFWETIPAPARTFLREAHAGYTLSGDWEACGMIAPHSMTTLAGAWENPDGIPRALDITGFAAGPSAHVLRRGDQCGRLRPGTREDHADRDPAGSDRCRLTPSHTVEMNHDGSVGRALWGAPLHRP